MTDQVVLGWADPGAVEGRFADSVLRVLYASQADRTSGTLPYDTIGGHLRVESGPRIASARNIIVRSYLAKDAWKDCEWLLMLDADMVFDENLVRQLLARARNADGKVMTPIVGGLCFGGGHGYIFPTMYRIVDPKENEGSPLSCVTQYEPGELVEVDATGAACLMIHRGVLEHMAQTFAEPAEWFAESMYAGREIGEDWTFCMRARSLGYPIFVNTAVKVGHRKAITLTEDTWRTGQSGLVSMGGVVGTPAPEIGDVRAASRPISTAPSLNRADRRAAARRSPAARKAA